MWGLQALLSQPGPEVRERWQRPSTKEYGSIFQGFAGAGGKDACFWVPKREAPRGEKATYPRAAAGYRPEKAGSPWRARITAGGGKLGYDGEAMASSAGCAVAKCHWNSALPSPGHKYSAMDAGNMYLESKLPKPRYARLKMAQIPEAIQAQHGLRKLADAAGYVHARIGKAWHGLKEAGRIAGDGIRDHLAAFGYHESKYTPGFFAHEARDISFTLAADDLGAKWKRLKDFEHLRDCLSLKHSMKAGMEAKQHAGIGLGWGYASRALGCSMGERAGAALEELEHALPKQKHHAPSKAARPGLWLQRAAC